jgi:hypothetical protein
MAEEEEKREAPKKGPSPLKIVGMIIGVIVVLAVFGVAYLYLGVIKPLQGLEVQPRGMEPVSLSPLTLDGTIDIHNPGKETSIPKIDLDLYIDDTLIGSGVVPEMAVPAGSTRSIRVTFTSGMSITDIILLLQGREQVSVKVGGKIHSRPIAIPIPRLPVPVDTTQLLGSLNVLEGSPVVALLSTLEENPDLTVAEALESGEFIAGFEKELGRDITDQEIAQLKDFFEKQGISDMKAVEILNDPAFIEMYQQIAGQ